MKKFLVISALMASTAVGGLACTKKTADRAPSDSPTAPPSSVPDTSTVPGTQNANPTTPAPNEMPGQPDSTNSVPGDTAPTGEGALPSDTTPAPESGTGGMNPNSPTPNNTTPPTP